jgi:hypothetical protein
MSYGLGEGPEQTFLVAILRFAIRLDLRLVLGEGRHLGKNHRELAIPAGYVGCGDKSEGRHDCGAPWHFELDLLANSGYTACCWSDSFCAAIFPDLLRELA